MKKTILIFWVLPLLMVALLSAAQTPTTFTFQFKNADGSDNTNYTTMQGWPPADQGVTVVSNLVVMAGPGQIITNNFQGTNVLGTNSAMPNTYRVFMPATGLGFLATIPATTNILPLALYAVGLPVTYPSSSFFFYITNALGFTPLGNTYTAVSNAVGFVFATNNGPIAYSQLPYTPPTNTLAGLINAAGFIFATNGGPVAVTQLPYVPATNPPAGFAFTGTLGYTNRSGTGSTLYITNGVVATNTTP